MYCMWWVGGMGATAEVDAINIEGASSSDLCTESCPVLDCLRRQLRGM